MMEQWGGAQWVLLTVMIVRWFMRALLNLKDWVEGFPGKSRAEAIGEAHGRWFMDAVIVSLLIWGGFWS